LKEGTDWLNAGGDVLVYDGSNLSRGRRDRLEAQAQTDIPGAQIMWMELICTSSDLITNNIRLTKLNNPDYKDYDPETAMADYLKRIEYCESMYQPLDSTFDSAKAFIKV
jgi:hypothetical protein